MNSDCFLAWLHVSYWIDCHECWLLFSLVIPFLRLGEVISGGPHFPLTSDALKKVVTGQASREILLSVLHAVNRNHHNNLRNMLLLNSKISISLVNHDKSSYRSCWAGSLLHHLFLACSTLSLFLVSSFWSTSLAAFPQAQRSMKSSKRWGMSSSTNTRNEWDKATPWRVLIANITSLYICFCSNKVVCCYFQAFHPPNRTYQFK